MSRHSRVSFRCCGKGEFRFGGSSFGRPRCNRRQESATGAVAFIGVCAHLGNDHCREFQMTPACTDVRVGAWSGSPSRPVIHLEAQDRAKIKAPGARSQFSSRVGASVLVSLLFWCRESAMLRIGQYCCPIWWSERAYRETSGKDARGPAAGGEGAPGRRHEAAWPAAAQRLPSKNKWSP
jgi:hypothetical protein